MGIDIGITILQFPYTCTYEIFVILMNIFHIYSIFGLLCYKVVASGGVTDSISLGALLEPVPIKYLSALLECLATRVNTITKTMSSTATATSTTITIPNPPLRGDVLNPRACVTPFTSSGVVSITVVDLGTDEVSALVLL